ncbi:MAG: MFS transporter, partial [Bifidobacteriales bacterium]|nr:MFS transporter [Bifidobacteriales bacterium]
MSQSVERSKRPLIVASIMLATFMVAIEATIVATAMPRIVGQLGGFTYYSWVFSAFLLAQSTTTVIYGKLSDIFGRKPMLIGGIVIFLAGSALAGFAWSMTSLIAFRLLQGLGAGAIQPVTMTIVGDLYRLEERAKVQGILASVWAISAVTGPLAGGLIVDHFSWAWIFWINLPIGLLTIIGFTLFLHEKIEPRKARIDYLGTILFSIAIVSLMVILTETDADLSIRAALAAVFIVTAILFFMQER